MRRHWNRPLISLAVLAAIAGSMLVVPAPDTQAQTTPATKFPGQTNPLASRAGALTQFPDDELVVVSDATNDSRYDIQEFSPAGDYSIPGGPAYSDFLKNPLNGSLRDPDGGYQHVNWTAKGRIVAPDRDVALTLTKTNVTTSPTVISWALQEMSFANNGPATPATVPSLTWSSQVVQNEPFAGNSPGALAVGDLDRVTTTNAERISTYNDEAVVAYEAPDPNNSRFTNVQVQVVNYVAVPGKATVTATAASLPPLGSMSNATFEYACSISLIPNGFCRRHPSIIEVALADVDADGYLEIAVLALMDNDSNDRNSLNMYLYSYCPPEIILGDPRAKYCTVGQKSTSLVLRTGVIVDNQSNIYHNPAKIVGGDFDGDGIDELAVVHLVNQRFVGGGLGQVNRAYADLQVAMLKWVPPADRSPAAPQAMTVASIATGDTMPSWFDGYTDPGQNMQYTDLQVTAGLFKFSPELGYNLNRRQLAIAYASALSVDTDNVPNNLQLELWDFVSPYSPVVKPPATQWTGTKYSTVEESLCNDSDDPNEGFASFGLVAGNWAGVKANPSSPLWGVAASYEVPGTIQANLYRVDQNVDPKTANGPLTRAATRNVTRHGDNNYCGDAGSRTELVSLDFDGDALQLGPPMHTVVDMPHDFDWILQEPPQHIDYFPEGNGVVNVSRTPEFNVAYKDAKGTTLGVGTASNSDWTAGGSFKANATFGVDGDYLIAKANLSASVTEQFNYDYQINEDTYTSSSDIYTETVSSTTAGADSLRFKSNTFDIWRYPVYGAKSQDPTQPYSYYELTLPRANANGQTVNTLDGLAAQTYGYQPVHENGNLFSYPAVPAGQPLQPADLGPWLLPKDSTGGPGAVRCENNTRWCLTVPITKVGQQFSFGGTANTQELDIEQTQGTNNGSSWTHKLSDSVDIEVNTKFAAFGTGSSGCANLQVRGGYSWGGSSNSTYSTDETQNLSVSIPANNDDTVGYHFNPMMYVTGDGTIKIAHGAGVDNGGTFWSARYSGVDPALNLPRKFNKPSTAPAWEINKDWLDAQELRGFWVRNATLDPITKTYNVVEGVKAGEKVLLDTRVYNYSMGTATGSVPVRFDLEPVSTDQRHVSTGPRFTPPNGTVTAPALPFHGQTDSNGNVLDNYTSVSYQLDTSNLLPAGELSQTYRVWVVLNPDDPANSAGQTHGWRQPNVILTPDTSVEAGTQVEVDLFDGYSITETVSYTSKGNDDNIAAGLSDQINKSKLVIAFGATASLQDQKTGTTSIAVSKTGAEPPDSDEYRAGLVEGVQQLYFIPRVPANSQSGLPYVTASNLEYGQNNEGWGMLTVYRSTVPGPMLGAEDPCALGSGFSAERGPDIQLRRGSLTPMPNGKRVAGGKVVVRAGDRVPIRVSAHTSTNWAGFERVTIFQGDPERDGIVAGTAQIRGIHQPGGGYDWFTWQAPAEPGTYELIAQLHENWNDPTTGNNTASVEIVVEPGPRLPYRFWLGAVSGRPQ